MKDLQMNLQKALADVAQLKQTISIQKRALVEMEATREHNQKLVGRDQAVSIAAYKQTVDILKDELNQAMNDNMFLMKELETCELYIRIVCANTTSYICKWTMR